MSCSSGHRKTPRSKRPGSYGVGKKKNASELDDTIVAIITPPGQGGVAALRIAGPESQNLLERLFDPSSTSPAKPFLMRHGRFRSNHGEIIDEVLAVFMPAGRSYTGLDQVEIFCHGGRQVVTMLLDEIIRVGARAAEPGEFTKLAFLHDRIDLSEAEAVAEMIAASTRVSYEASLQHLVGGYSDLVDQLRGELLALRADIESSIDFSEEEIEPNDRQAQVASIERIAKKLKELAATYEGGRIVREGFRIAIGGRPNAGKSSLFNLLLKQERALVDPEPGTTRDYLSEWIDLDGFAVNIIDTAGLRADAGTVEQKGQDRARELIESADLLLWMADVCLPDWQETIRADIASLRSERIVLIGNKIDLVAERPVGLDGPLPLSCVTKVGLAELRSLILGFINVGMPDLTSGQVVTSARHKGCLDRASQSLAEVRDLVNSTEAPEIVAFELRRATDALGEITGKVYTEEILGEIFARFCIGK